MNAQLNYSALGLGGTGGHSRRPRFPAVLREHRAELLRQRWATRLAATFPTWNFNVHGPYPIGRSNAEANLARARLQNQQSREADRSQELQVATQIRDFARHVQTNTKRVEATRSARALAEQRLEAEEKKFQAGMTSSFLVFQAQRDLNQARNNELQALIDYLKSVVDFQTVAGSTADRRWRGHGVARGRTGQQQQELKVQVHVQNPRASTEFRSDAPVARPG